MEDEWRKRGKGRDGKRNEKMQKREGKEGERENGGRVKVGG